MYRILDVMYVDDLVFWSCPQCMYKVNEVVSTDQTNKSTLFCDKCQEVYLKSTIRRKYKLSMKVCDLSSRQIRQLTVFGKSIEAVIGCDADEYHRLASEQSMNISSDVKSHLLKALLRKDVTVKINNVQNVTSCRPVIKGHSLNVISFSKEQALVKQLWVNDKISAEKLDEALDRPVTPDSPATPDSANEHSAGDVEVTWQESLIAEFNQSLILEPPPQETKYENWLTNKRCRGDHSLNNTPSAPARTKAKTDKDMHCTTQQMCPFMSPLQLPADFRTPIRQNKGKVLTPTSIATNFLSTSTPVAKVKILQDTPVTDMSRDLFFDSELTELESF